MGRTPCCDKKGLKKGPWGPEEDEILVDYINKNGHGSWRNLPKLAGLLRCGKSCRLRWTNYLRPDIKRGPFSSEEEKLVIQLHGILGNRWAAIACQLPGRTDNEIKNLWNTHLKKRLLHMGIDPQTHEPTTTIVGLKKPLPASPSTRHMAQWESARLEAEARLSRESLFLTPTKSENATSDHFLHLWNSEIGDSFRNVRKGNRTVCPSPISQASSSTKCRSFSGTTMETETPLTNDGLVYKCDTVSSSSNEMEDSSDTALQLLLDFPGGNDMSFLEQSDDYGYCHPISTESYSNCSQ